MEENPLESLSDSHDKAKEKKIENTLKTVTLLVDKKTFKVDFKNEIEFLSVIAKLQDGLFPVHYTGKFSLKDIKKVGLFRDYESIDECLFEIFEGLNSTPKAVEQDNENIIIHVPLHTRRYPEIAFPLKQIAKTDSQKYEDLTEAFLDMKKQKDREIKELKEKIDKLENLIHINKKSQLESKEILGGSKLEIYNIGKDKYFEYFPQLNQYEEEITGLKCSIILECNESFIKDVIDTFNKYKKEIKEIFYIHDSLEDLNIRSDKNKIFIDWVTINDGKDNKKKNNQDFLFHDIINRDQLLLYFPLVANGLKAILKTEATLIDFFEKKSKKKINNMIYNTKIDFEGDKMMIKIFMSFIVLLFNLIKDDSDLKSFYNLINDIFLTVINGNFNYIIQNKNMFHNFKKDKKELLNFLRFISFKGIEKLSDQKYRIFQKVDFNKIKVGILGSPLFKVGYFGINFESLKNNEFIDKVLNKVIKYKEGDEENEDEDDEE